MKTSTDTAARKPLRAVRWSGLLLMVACAPFAGRGDVVMATDEKGITVTVLLYSGRPDPTYDLDNEALITQIKASIAAAEPASGPADQDVIPSILGYKGIRVQSRVPPPGFPSRIELFRGKMAVVDGQRRVLIDKDGALEKALLDEAIRKKVIDDRILERMKKQP